MDAMKWLRDLVAGRNGKEPKVKTTLSAKVIRKDGTVEDLGVISETESKPWGVESSG